MTAWVVAPGVGETGWFSLLYPPRPTALPPGATEESPLAILPGIPYITQITPFLHFCKFPILSLTTSMCQINHRKWRFLNAGLDCIRNQAGHRTQESSVGFLNVRGQGGVGAGIRCALLLTRTNIRIFLYFILAVATYFMLLFSCTIQRTHFKADI